MRKTSGLTRSSINGNSNINDISDATEEVCEIAVCHLKRHVTDEEGLGGRVDGLARGGGLGIEATCIAGGVLNCETAAFEEGHIEALKCSICSFLRREIDISET